MFHHCVPVAAQSTPIWWPEKLPGTSINQTFDTTLLPDPIHPSQIQSLSAQIAPSGAGELQADFLGLYGSEITLLESGGQPGRVYRIMFTATLVNNETVQWIIHQAVAFISPFTLVPPPPVPGYGTEINWMPIILVASGLIAALPTQADAVALGGFTNVFSTVLAGAGAILPTFITNGTFKVVNNGANTLLVYPPFGAQIGTYGPNVPIGVFPGGASSFSTSAPLSQWTAS